jgi:hypothetical protein
MGRNSTENREKKRKKRTGRRVEAENRSAPAAENMELIIYSSMDASININEISLYFKGNR